MVTLRTQGFISSRLKELRLQIGRMLKREKSMKMGGLYYELNWDSKDDILEAVKDLEKRLEGIKMALKFES